MPDCDHNPGPSGEVDLPGLKRHGKERHLKLSLCLTKHHNIMVCGSVEIYLHDLLAAEVDANCVQLRASADLCAGKDINIFSE